MSDWHDRDDFWTTLEPALFSPSRAAEAPFEAEAAIRLLNLSPGARVLDLCAGPGRHAIELARRGMRVTAVDRTRAYLDRARESAHRAAIALELVEADMRHFRRDAAFDGALNLYNSFGYFEDPAENRAVAENLRRSLVPRGAALFDMVGKELFGPGDTDRTWREIQIEGRSALVLEERRICPDWTYLEWRWILVNGREQADFRVRQHLYSGAELRALLLSAGFESITLYGGFDGRPYDRGARCLVAVARAPCRRAHCPG